MRGSRMALISVMLVSWASASALIAEGVDLAQRMSAAEFQRCGLDKLSSEELKALSAWVQTYAEEVAESAVKAEMPEEPSVIESHIRGDFEGWEGDSIFVLVNGQVWEQVEYHYHYHYAYRPAVTIVRTKAGWMMKVEGVSKVIRVERVR